MSVPPSHGFAPDFVAAVSERVAHQQLFDASAVAFELSGIILRGCFKDFVSTQLRLIASDLDHRGEGAVGQTSFAVHRDANWEYVVSIIYPDRPRANQYLWTGDQAIVVSERGSARYRLFRAPSAMSINTFQKGSVSVEVTSGKFSSRGGHVISGSREFFEVWTTGDEVDGLHFVSIKDPTVRLHWAFDHSLTAIYVESLTIEGSRLTSMLDVYDATGQAYPEELIERILGFGSEALTAELICRLLRGRDARAFSYLNSLIQSDDPPLSSGGQELLRQLLQHQEDVEVAD